MSEQKGNHNTHGGSNQIGALERGQGLARNERTGQPFQNGEEPFDEREIPKMTISDAVGRNMPDRERTDGGRGNLIPPHAQYKNHPGEAQPHS